MSSHIPVQALIFDLRIGRCSFQRVSKYKNHRLTLGDWKYSLVTSLAPIRMWPSVSSRVLYGSPGLQIGNQGVTVAMFLKALLSQRSLPAMVCEAPLMEDIALIT
ncbi:hypothetical protein HBH93_099600 [Parastagonospora nodorum]|nr:hypothetical protein HBH50_159590 [Parastagonospora nodorum]KAH4437461.1 hypothetical protein HBH93_099600 [Parastagonospora nodorum]KAH4880440.1 hypothetical protein HBH58_080480 [Parastagonospora nodorum]